MQFNKAQASVSYQLMKIGLIIHWFPSSQELKQDNAKAVNIRLLIQSGSSGILRIDVSDSTHDIGGGMGLGDT